MKTSCFLAVAALLACNLAAFAQSDVLCGQTLDVPLRSGSELAIESRPAGLELVGTDRDVLHVVCSSDDPAVSRHIRVHFAKTASGGKLAINGGFVSHGNLRVRIEVPRKTGLGIQMPAGQVTTEEIVGDKDIDLYAGQISISSNHGWDYRTVDASVVVGQVNAPAFGANKGGFFRSFKRDAADGDYHLHAHVLTGQIELLGRGEHASTD